MTLMATEKPQANTTRIRSMGGGVVTWTPTRIVGRTRNRAMGIRLGNWACTGCGGHVKDCPGASATDHATTCYDAPTPSMETPHA